MARAQRNTGQQGGAQGTRARGRRRNPSLPNDLNAPIQRRRYHNILATMMEYLNHTTYPDDKNFTDAELGALTPTDIYRWMCSKIYGREDPGHNDSPQIRSTTIQYWKKAISYFMPTDAPWNDAAQIGNPTKSRMINRLSAAVRRAETRGQGKKSRADRSFTDKEFVQALDLMGSFGGGSAIDRKRFQAMMKFQYHLIGRSDDTAHVKKSTLEASNRFPGHMTVQMRWSKNVYEERDCPKQLLMGSMDPKYCVILGLVLFLEKWIANGEGAASQWLFADGVTTTASPMDEQDREAVNLKGCYSRYIGRSVLDNAAFERDAPGNLGTHSIRKIATTTCRQRGASKDDADYRARWKMNRRMQDRYTDTQLYWPDINAASKLCQGGVAIYKVKDGLGLTDDWLAATICPNIASSFGNKVAAILAKALVWATFEESTKEEVPLDLVQSVSRAILDKNLEGLAEGANPIEKVELIPSETGGAVVLDEIPPDDDMTGELGTRRRTEQWKTAMYAKVRTTGERVTAIQHNQVSEFAELKKRLRNIESTLRILSAAPARIIPTAHRTGRGVAIRTGTTTAPDGRPAALVKCPRTLAVLWDEYQNGVEGHKPAREFTAQERGRVKVLYSKRNKFWKCMVRLINGGCTVVRAIERIHGVYGYGSVTSILKKLMRDEPHGGHARLRT